MKTRLITFFIFFLFIILLFFWIYKLKQINNEKNIWLENTIKNQKIEIENLRKKQVILAKIEKFRNIKNNILNNRLKAKIKNLESEKSSNLLIKESINFEKEKILDVNFYSQFPLDLASWVKYDEPYQNFCEEASLLNWYYYLIWKKPNLEKYNKDLLRLREIQDLILDWWYKHSSLQDTLKILIAFQDEKTKVFWEILKNPTIQDIKENINKRNVIIAPLYWKWLSNPYFKWWWPIYHNLLIKWYTEQNFIVNEVWISKWDWFKYNQNEIMKNIHNFEQKKYPDNFQEWKKEILILYK